MFQCQKKFKMAKLTEAGQHREMSIQTVILHLTRHYTHFSNE